MARPLASKQAVRQPSYLVTYLDPYSSTVTFKSVSRFVSKCELVKKRELLRPTVNKALPVLGGVALFEQQRGKSIASTPVTIRSLAFERVP